MAALLFVLTAGAESAPLIGSSAPALSLPALNGRTFDLPSLRGAKKTVLTFFTSWSKSCQQELGALGGLYAANRSRLEVVAVSFDKKTKDLKNYLAAADLPFTVLQDKKLAAIDSYQIIVIPTTFCINDQGTIEKVFVDYDDNVQKALEEWLKP